MKANFSTSWIESKQPRKQRKYRHNAPLHIKHKFLSANLSKELRKKHGKRSIPIRKEDEVLVMRGKFAKKKGKILTVSLATGRITIDGINRKKIDGTSINVPIQPSNVQIMTMAGSDRKRVNKVAAEKEKPKKEESKEHKGTKAEHKDAKKTESKDKQEKKNASEKIGSK
jgi:large subunit ribosomal protein L24